MDFSTSGSCFSIYLSLNDELLKEFWNNCSKLLQPAPAEGAVMSAASSLKVNDQSLHILSPWFDRGWYYNREWSYSKLQTELCYSETVHLYHIWGCKRVCHWAGGELTGQTTLTLHLTFSHPYHIHTLTADAPIPFTHLELLLGPTQGHFQPGIKPTTFRPGDNDFTTHKPQTVCWSIS